MEQKPKERLMKGLLTVVLAAGLGSVAMPAPAQPLHGGGPLAMLSTIKPQLNLNTSQQQQWDAVVEQTKAAHEAARANRAQVKAALTAELAKPEPDFAALAALSDGVHQQNRALHLQTRNAWLALYATMSPEQKGLARDAIKARVERIDAWRSTHSPRTPSS
jgi:Spy/CpxP family protein refolding chaperone